MAPVFPYFHILFRKLLKLTLFVASCVAVSLFAPTLSIASQTAFTPSGVIAAVPGAEIYGFASSGTTMLRLLGEPVVYKSPYDGNFDAPVVAEFSEDAGATWQSVAWPLASDYSSGVSNLRAMGISVAPDGAFWISAKGATRLPSLMRFDPISKTWMSQALQVDSSFRLSAPEFSGSETFLSIAKSVELKLVAVKMSDGSVSDIAASSSTGALAQSSPVETKSFNGQLYSRIGQRWFHSLAGSLVSLPQGEVPLVELADVTLTLDGVFWTENGFPLGGSRQRPIEGLPGTVISSPGILRDRGGSNIEFLEPSPPFGVNRFIKVGTRYLALLDLSRASTVFAGTSSGDPERLDTGFGQTATRVGSTVFEFDGTPYSKRLIDGNPSANARTFGNRLNEQRVRAGLPPVLLDGYVSQAAANHSRYWTLNPVPTAKNNLDYHYEEPGKPGFTGQSPSDRCAAVGPSVKCGGEVLYAGVEPVAAIDGWLATPYHGAALNDPVLITFGADKISRGPAVADLNAPFYGGSYGSLNLAGGGSAAALQIRPSGFPNGFWDGPLEFDGESPDPLKAPDCKTKKMSYPVGSSITATTPFGRVNSVTVKRVSDGATLTGCEVDVGDFENKRSFIPQFPLSGGQTYRATASWSPGSPGAFLSPRSFDWSFKAVGPIFRGKPCRPQVRFTTQRSKRRVKIAMKLCKANRAVVQRRIRGRLRTVKRFGRAALKKNKGRFVLKLPRRGKAFPLRIVLYDGKKVTKKASRTVRVRR